MHFKRSDVTAYYECDVTNKLKLSGVLRYMQQTSSLHLCSLGLPVEKLFHENLVFLLTKTNLKIHRLPVCNEGLTIGTAPTEIIGPRFIREYFIDNAEGERLVSAYSLWVLCDVSSHKILRPSAFPYDFKLHPTELCGAVGDIAIPKNIPDDSTCTGIQIPVRYSHLDVNHHVNNCFYADFVCDALPYSELTTRGISKVALCFQAEASLGETLDIECARLSPLTYKITGAHKGERRFESYVEMNG